MIANLIKTLITNANLTQKQAAELLHVEESTLEKYEKGIIIPRMYDLILFSIKTNQEIENIVRSQIKAYLKDKGHFYLNGTIIGLELIHFDFVSQEISFSLVEKCMESKFSIFELSYLLDIPKEIVREEIKDEISEIEDSEKVDERYQFINWYKYASLVEKYVR